MDASGRYCFVADLHLGPDTDPDGARERAFVQFLHTLPPDIKGLYLLGDIFDFWVDYHDVVPRGNVRLLAALAGTAERMDVWFFRGNHDWWLTDYFEKELGVHIVQEPYRILELNGVRVMVGHGDTLGAHDLKSKMIFHLFRNKVCIALLKALHPRWVFAFARRWAAASRRRHTPPPAFAAEATPVYRFVNEFGKGKGISLYLFGHWHSPGQVPVESGGTLHLLGAWTRPEDAFYL